MNYKKLSYEEKGIMISIPILFVVGTAFHFLYELCGNNFIIGLFAPVNESIFEHTKLAMLPVMLWWIIYYIAKGKKYNINKNKWFTASLVSLITSILLIPFIFYFYTQAFGVESLIFDIIIFLIAVICGQLLGLHFYKHSNGFNYKFVLYIFIIIVLLYILFTLNPPTLPIFKDTSTNLYGMK